MSERTVLLRGGPFDGQSRDRHFCAADGSIPVLESFAGEPLHLTGHYRPARLAIGVMEWCPIHDSATATQEPT